MDFMSADQNPEVSIIFSLQSGFFLSGFLIICSRGKKQMRSSGQKYWGDKGDIKQHLPTLPDHSALLEQFDLHGLLFCTCFSSVNWFVHS